MKSPTIRAAKLKGFTVHDRQTARRVKQMKPENMIIWLYYMLSQSNIRTAVPAFLTAAGRHWSQHRRWSHSICCQYLQSAHLEGRRLPMMAMHFRRHWVKP